MHLFNDASAVRLQVCFCVLAAAFYFGLRRSDENNRCHMTYMWRRMHFMGLDVNSSSRYSLILYGEGKYASEFLNTEYVNGLPIIFVPGNAGSGRQIRSLGSMLQNKTDLRNSTFHFDTFAVDFNQELSGLSSEYFSEQTRFLAEAIKYVWDLYEKKPPGIVLIGHSMGGIVIRSLFSDATFHDKHKILFTIAFASPLNEPPLYFDSGIFRIWQNLRLTQLNDHNQPLVSISGGLKDEFIDESWTYNDGIFHASTMSLDRVWLTTDHNCIVWCNQIVKHASRLLFDYASSISDFVHHPEKLLIRHYQGSGRELLPISRLSHRIPKATCNPKCPNRIVDIVLTLEQHSAKDLIVVAISKELTTNLIELNCLDMDDKPHNVVVRHLTGDRLFAVVKLRQHLPVSEICIKSSNSSVWILNEKLTYASPLQIHPVDLILPQEHFLRVENGLKVLPVSLNYLFDSLVLKLSIRRYNCNTDNADNQHRIVLESGNSTLFSDIDDSGNEFLYVYKLERSHSPNLWLNFYDENKCEYSLKFSIKSHYTFVRALRLYRHLIPVHLLVAILALYYYRTINDKIYEIIFLVAISLGLIGVSSSIESVAIILSVNITTIFVLSNVLYLLELLIMYFTRWLSIGKNSIWCILLFFLPFTLSLCFHSAIAGIFYGFVNLFSINSVRTGCRKNYRLTFSALQCGALALQLPSVIVYVWNFRRYGHLRPLSSDYFITTNIILFAISFTNLLFAFKKLTDFPLVQRFLQCWRHFMRYGSVVGIATIFNNNPDSFYQILNEISTVYALVLAFLWNRTS